MKYPNLLSSGLFVLATTACFSPKPIAQLTPTTKPSSWFYGKEVLTREVDSVRVSLIFDRWAGDQLVFATEVINRSADTVLVAPETFFYEAFRYDTAAFSQIARALDPEREILEIEKTISREWAARRNDLVFDVALAAATVAVAVAAEATSDGEYYDGGGGSVNFYFGSADSSNDLPFLNHLREQWVHQALRKTSLPPGQVMRGSVVFLDQPDAFLYTVYVQIEDSLLPFDYRKHFVQP